MEGIIVLLFFVLLLSVCSGVGLCLLSGGFAGLGWLWQLPVGFLGGFLLTAVLSFAVLIVICYSIDPEKPREKDSRWFRTMIMWYIQAILTVLPIRIKKQGMEKFCVEGRFMLVCNHLDNIDPAFLLSAFPKSQLAFVSKKETRDMFLVGHALPKLLCPFINRENDREALKTILRCISLLKNDVVSIAVFPEGRINKYRKLAHFRPGVFKIAQKANVPIVVCTMRNTNHVIGRLLKGKGSTVDLRLLEVIPAQELQSCTTVEIADRVYNLMAADLGPENILSPEEEENA